MPTPNPRHATLAVVDLLAEHLERTVDLLDRHIDGLELDHRAHAGISLDVGAVQVGIRHLRATVADLNFDAEVELGAADVVDEAQRTLDGGDL